PSILAGVANVVRGKTTKANGEAYHPDYVERVWGGLCRLCRRADLWPLLKERRAGEELHLRLFGVDVATLTGRVRAGVSYTQARNTPPQGLAADGAKRAVWRLLRAGFRVVGFVHDELLIELADEGGFVSEAVIDRVTGIVIRAMEEVLQCDL